MRNPGSSPNTRLQRTRSAPRRSPLSRSPLGRRSTAWALVTLCAIAMVAVGGGTGSVPSVQGVSLGALKVQVLAAFGTPASSQSGKDTEMGQGETLDLSYLGLAVDLCKPDGQGSQKPAKDFHVWRLVVTGKKWTVSPGLRVGMSRKEVEAVLGKPASAETRGHTETLHYSPFKFDAFLWVTLKDGVVMEIGMAEDWS